MGTDDGKIIVYRIETKLGDPKGNEPNEALVKVAIEKLGSPVIKIECADVMVRSENSSRDKRSLLVIATTQKGIYSFYGADEDPEFLSDKYSQKSPDEVNSFSSSC